MYQEESVYQPVYLHVMLMPRPYVNHMSNQPQSSANADHTNSNPMHQHRLTNVG